MSWDNHLLISGKFSLVTSSTPGLMWACEQPDLIENYSLNEISISATENVYYPKKFIKKGTNKIHNKHCHSNVILVTALWLYMSCPLDQNKTNLKKKLTTLFYFLVSWWFSREIIIKKKTLSCGQRRICSYFHMKSVYLLWHMSFKDICLIVPVVRVGRVDLTKHCSRQSAWSKVMNNICYYILQICITNVMSTWINYYY